MEREARPLQGVESRGLFITRCLEKKDDHMCSGTRKLHRDLGCLCRGLKGV